MQNSKHKRIVHASTVVTSLKLMR